MTPYQEQTLTEKTKKSINKFAALGGSAALVGLIATNDNLVTNALAQDIGFGSALVAAGCLLGAAWKWASLEDAKNGKTLTTEFKEIKEEFSNKISSLRNAWNEENPKTELDQTKPSVSKQKFR